MYMYMDRADFLYVGVYSDHCTASPPCACVWPFTGDNCDTRDVCSHNVCNHGTCYNEARNGRGRLYFLYRPTYFVGCMLVTMVQYFLYTKT